MTKKQVFQKSIFPKLKDVILWKNILFLTKRDVYILSEIGLIKKQKSKDNENNLVIEFEDYQIYFDKHMLYVIKIEKGNELLYKYIDKKAFKERPQPVYLEITE